MPVSTIPLTSAVSGTLPLANGGTATTGAPAFSASRTTTDQTLSQSTWAKVQFQSENFDTNSCYDTTNFRFTPNVAGYYSLQANIFLSGGAAFFDAYAQFYKNGTGTGQYQINTLGSGNWQNLGQTPSTLVYANGTTDYFEIYVYSNSASPNVTAGPTYFTGFLARAA